jgi:nucleoside-diphosphate kinase
MQRTLILFKPDCVQRRLVGEVLRRFEARGFRIDALKLMQVDRALAEEHYAEHHERPFFAGLLEFLTAGPVVAAVLSGPNVIAVARKMIGKTDAPEAEPGTIRGDLAISKQNNLIHGSDSPESADREIGLWFRPEELLDYEVADARWTTGA